VSRLPHAALILAVCAFAAPLAHAATPPQLHHVRVSQATAQSHNTKKVTHAPIACSARTRTVVNRSRVRMWQSAKGRLTRSRARGAGHWTIAIVTVRTTVPRCTAASGSSNSASGAAKTTTKTTNQAVAASSDNTPTAPAGAPAAAGPLTIGIVANTAGWRLNAGQLQDKVMQTGVKWLREELDWSDVETSPGQYDWSNYDALYTAASQRGLHILPLVMATPTWAGPSIQTPPTDPTAYANFVATVVKRYGPGGAFWAAHPELVPAPSSQVELWNEPWYQPNTTAAMYAHLVAAAGAAAHAANPAVQVLLADDISTQTVGGKEMSWTDAMYAAVPNLNQFFDIVAVHPYGATLTAKTDDVYGRFRMVMEDIRSDLVAHGAADKPFWLTEIGWSTCVNGQAGRCFSEADQATLLSQLFTLVHTTYSGYVRGVFVYHYNDFPGAAASDPEGHFGLTRADGSPKPAYAVFQAAVAAG
jgi:polysaccharide biosynthesis protein PslG